METLNKSYSKTEEQILSSITDEIQEEAHRLISDIAGFETDIIIEQDGSIIDVNSVSYMLAAAA